MFKLMTLQRPSSAHDLKIQILIIRKLSVKYKPLNVQFSDPNFSDKCSDIDRMLLLLKEKGHGCWDVVVVFVFLE